MSRALACLSLVVALAAAAFIAARAIILPNPPLFDGAGLVAVVAVVLSWIFWAKSPARG